MSLNLNVKKTRKQVFLEQMEQVVPWAELVELIALYYPEGKTGRPPFSWQIMLRTHSLQQWFTLSDPGMEEAFFEHSSQKGNQWHFGMKAHIGADADSGLVHTVRGTSGNVHDVVEGSSLLHGEETLAYGDAGYQGIDKRADADKAVSWQIAMRPGKRKALNKDDPAGALIDKAEKLKAGIRAKVEHPFRVIKRQFGFVKVRYRGLKKNTAQLFTLFALSNLWMVRSKLMDAQA